MRRRVQFTVNVNNSQGAESACQGDGAGAEGSAVCPTGAVPWPGIGAYAAAAAMPCRPHMTQYRLSRHPRHGVTLPNITVLNGQIQGTRLHVVVLLHLLTSHVAGGGTGALCSSTVWQCHSVVRWPLTSSTWAAVSAQQDVLCLGQGHLRLFPTRARCLLPRGRWHGHMTSHWGLRHVTHRRRHGLAVCFVVARNNAVWPSDWR